MKEGVTKWKGGGIPYYIDAKGEIHVCLFLSNNAYYGGKNPQIPKGHPDKGDIPVDTASREAHEETGLPLDKLKKSAKKLSSDIFHGETHDYIMHVFMFKMDKMYKTSVNNEGEGKWFKIDDALKDVRRQQKPYLIKLKDKLKR